MRSTLQFAKRFGDLKLFQAGSRINLQTATISTCQSSSEQPRSPPSLGPQAKPVCHGGYVGSRKAPPSAKASAHGRSWHRSQK